MNDPISGFQDAIADAGLGQPEIVADGDIHRFNTPADKRGKKSGWFVFYRAKIAVGVFGSWKTGESHSWCSKNKTEFTDEEKAAYRESIQKAKAERDAEQKKVHAEAAESARRSWSGLKPASADHQYLQRKGIAPHIAKIKGGNLVIPVFAARADGKSTDIVGLQYISPRGEKWFLLGTQKKGSFCLVAGSLKDADLVVVCEGFSTAASVHEATGLPTFISFDCFNLQPAAEAIRKQHPAIRIVIAGDNDQWKGETNPGCDAAEKAARAVNGAWCVPDFKGLDTSARPSDFNDLAALSGLEVVRMQIDADVKEALKEVKRQVEPDADTVATTKKKWTKPTFKEITDINRIVKVLANLPPLEYEQHREPIAKKFNVRVSVLDQEVGRDRPQSDDKGIQGRTIELYEPELWPEPVKAGAALDEVLAVIRRHMFMTETESYACALWIAHAHMFDAFSHTPRLVITAADFGCGKTLLLTHIVGDMIPRPLPCETITPAPFFRMAELHKPAFLIDEVDQFITQDSDLLAGINNGWEPHGGAIRCVGDDNEPRIFSTHTPMAMAGINLPNKLPESTFSRSVIVDLERAAEDDIRENDIYDREQHRAATLIAGRKLARWIADNRDGIKVKQPKLPPKVRNRTADKWKPLFKIAQVAGGEWPDRAKKALFGQPDLSEPCKALQLLIDSASVFKDGERGIHTTDLIERLVDIDDSLWKDYNFRQREDNRRWITTRQIAGLLKRYKIKSCQIRIGAINKHGYHCEPIKNALKRYATPLNTVAPPIPDATMLHPTDGAASSDFHPLQKNNGRSGKKAPQATDDAGCSVVADTQGGAIDVKHRDIGAI